MLKILVLSVQELPSPTVGYDLVLWNPPVLPSPTALRTWAGWSESALIAGSTQREGNLQAYSADTGVWAGTALAMGNGMVYRWHHNYIAWIHDTALVTPEVGRALACAGVEFIVSEGVPEAENPFVHPLWRTVQSNQIYGLHLDAKPEMYVPCEIDPDENGVWTPESLDGGHAITLDFAQLADAARIFPIRPGLKKALYCAHRWWQV